MASHLLTTVTSEQYQALVDEYDNSKGDQGYALYACNLPLMWRMCNGSGTMKGTGLLQVDEEAIQEVDLFPNLVGRRPALERLVSDLMTDDVVQKACRRLMDETYWRFGGIFSITHPSDWLFVLCYFIYQLDGKVSKDIIEDSPLLIQAFKQIIEPSVPDLSSRLKEYRAFVKKFGNLLVPISVPVSKGLNDSSVLGSFSIEGIYEIAWHSKAAPTALVIDIGAGTGLAMLEFVALTGCAASGVEINKEYAKEAATVHETVSNALEKTPTDLAYSQYVIHRPFKMVIGDITKYEDLSVLATELTDVPYGQHHIVVLLNNFQFGANGTLEGKVQDLVWALIKDNRDKRVDIYHSAPIVRSGNKRAVKRSKSATEIQSLNTEEIHGRDPGDGSKFPGFAAWATMLTLHHTYSEPVYN